MSNTTLTYGFITDTSTGRCYAGRETSLGGTLQINLANASPAAVITADLGEALNLLILLKQIESQTLHKYQEAKHNYEARCGKLQCQLNYSLHSARKNAYGWKWVLPFFSTLGTGAAVGWMAYLDTATYKTLSGADKALSAVWLADNVLFAWVWGLVVRLRTTTLVLNLGNEIQDKQFRTTLHVVVGPGLGRLADIGNMVSLFLMLYGIEFWSSLILITLQSGFRLLLVTACQGSLRQGVAQAFGEHECRVFQGVFKLSN
jgi:hypothetical protein